jgi:alkylglycerol monooxygenase
MDLIALAVPFFILALIVELLLDRRKQTKYYRSNDAINSISAGILSITTEYFSKFFELLIISIVLSHFALFEMQLGWFDVSARGIALWIVAAIAWDFCYYWRHRFGHEISILWAAHSVHHQSEDYNLSTALRQTSTGFIFNWIFYLPLYVVGFPVEVLVTVGAANLIYQFWVHTRLIDRLGVLDRVLVTPSNHRVHHAQNQRYIDKNYGGIFILWDRFFGTYAAEDKDEPVVFGVRKPLSNWNPVFANFQVYSYLLFDTIRTRRWRDKFGVWFGRTGWRPDDVAAGYPKSNADIEKFRKFDPPVSNARRRYVVAQFIALLAVFVFIADAYAVRGAGAVFVPCLLMWTQLYTIGLLSENRPYAVRFELVRLLIVLPIGIYALDESLITLTPTVGVVIASYLLVSLLWLRKK